MARRSRSLLGHRSVGGEQLHCASLVFSWVLFLSLFVIFLFITIIIIVIFFIIVIFYFTLVIKQFLSHPTSFTFFSPILLPIPLGGGRSEGAAAWCLVAGWG